LGFAVAIWGVASALGGRGARAESETFALIVTNNRSASLDRPDLQYADDDGARYHALFRSVAPDDHVVLLTRFDRASKETYPDLAGSTRPPQMGELRAAIAALRHGIERSQQAGRQTVFYFVFAGHGDVDRGKGFLEMEDGRLDADFLEHQVIEQIPASVQHIVLDSCNSFFVINPRKPGGRRWATPKDLTEGFSKRHPQVGVLLSANADAEVYEWSELESGIFSYEVRSGLAGAADVNGDGRVSYDELAGYIETANRRVPNEQFRPRILSRGPSGQGSAELFSSALIRGRRVVIGEGERRVWIRNDRGGRLVDLFKEETGELAVTVPGPVDQPLTVYEQIRSATAERPSVQEYSLPSAAGAVAILASQGPSNASTQARGGEAIFGRLFADPYGARAYGQYLSGQGREAEPVFGVSRGDELRMRHYLGGLSESSRTERLSTGWALIGVGAAFSAVGFDELDRSRSDSAAISFAIGGGLAVWGVTTLLLKSDGERAYEAFETEAKRAVSQEALVAKTEYHLERLAARQRRIKHTIGILLMTAGGITASGILIDSVSRPERIDERPAFYAFLGIAAAFTTSYGVWTYYDETPTERLLRLYHQDPDLNLRFGVAPLTGGAALAVSGRF
jgi:hypothetical protein